MPDALETLGTSHRLSGYDLAANRNVIASTKERIRRQLGEALIASIDADGPVVVGPLQWHEGAYEDPYIMPMNDTRVIGAKMRVLHLSRNPNADDFERMLREVNS